jgi:hypothetical protein
MTKKSFIWYSFRTILCSALLYSALLSLTLSDEVHYSPHRRSPAGERGSHTYNTVQYSAVEWRRRGRKRRGRRRSVRSKRDGGWRVVRETGEKTGQGRTN